MVDAYLSLSLAKTSYIRLPEPTLVRDFFRTKLVFNGIERNSGTY